MPPPMGARWAQIRSVDGANGRRCAARGGILPLLIRQSGALAIASVSDRSQLTLQAGALGPRTACVGSDGPTDVEAIDREQQ